MSLDDDHLRRRPTAWTRPSRRSPTDFGHPDRASQPAAPHRITVDYYGAPTPLQQLANFSVPEPRILIVNPFDKGSVNQIEKAIRDSDLGLNPSTDGTVIRCVFPELTEERRKDFIKLAKHAAEDGKVAVRNVRAAPATPCRSSRTTARSAPTSTSATPSSSRS
jgi:hypothetical protein